MGFLVFQQLPFSKHARQLDCATKEPLLKMLDICGVRFMLKPPDEFW
jgi:hypothetical protein